LSSLSLVEASPEHFPTIVRIERQSPSRSIVAATEGHALYEALERGHWVCVAMRNDDVVGWIWFTVELVGGEHIGSVLRIAVDRDARRRGAGTALLAHARRLFEERACTRMRLSVAGEDEGARAFFASAGFTVDAIHMDAPL
jgi:ribosomal protein S18 acetylase RimI-like enzyme